MPGVREQLILRRDFAALGGDSRLRRACASGELTRVATGVYIPAALWNRLSADDRFLAVVHAAALRFPQEVFSHRSAAALWGLPITGAWPPKAETSVSRAEGGRSNRGVIRRAVGLPASVTEIDGVRVTTLGRTVVDAASVGTFEEGVAFADRALRMNPSLQLADELASASPTGRERARRVVAFADGRAESAGESLSRTAIMMLGFAAPQLQVALHDDSGFVGRVDFAWPEHAVVGEFDGAGKYLREEWMNGRSAAEVVIAEKRREDRIRALGLRVARWGWSEARSPRVLELRLTAAGVPRG